MSNYAQITLFTPKDSLVTGNPLKLVRGSEVDAELAAISVAIATKFDSTSFANPTGTIGLAAVNGILSTPMRSDAAPALSQAIAPTWSGQHTWSLSLRAPDGLVGTPAFTFGSDTDTGIYRGGANDFRIATGGVLAFGMDTVSISAALPVRSADGSAATPAYSFTSDPDIGLYRNAANALAFAANGVFAGGVRVVTATPQFSGADGTPAEPYYSFNNDLDTGIYRPNANQIGFAVGGGFAGRVESTAQLGWTDGSAAAPSYTFDNDLDTGYYRVGVNSAAFSSGGFISAVYNGGLWSIGDGFASGDRVRLTNNVARSASNLEHYFNHQPTMLDIYSYDGASTAGGIIRMRQQQAQFADGVVGTPVLSFASDTTTGFYRTASGDASFSAANSRVFRFFAAASGGAQVADPAGTLQTVGYRQLPRSTTSTTLAAGDVGKCVAITAAINIPVSVFSAGDAITIYNDSAGALNLTISGGTLRLAGTASTGTRSIAARGFCTIWFNSGGATPEVIASGQVS